MRPRASSFNWQYPLLSLKSSSSFLRLLPRLLVTSICPFIFPSITCCRRQFLRKMWPIQLAFHFLISCDPYYLARMHRGGVVVQLICGYSSTLSLPSEINGGAWLTPPPAALPPGINRCPLNRMPGGPQSRSGRVRKSRSHWIRNPGRPVHSESLYRLSYPGARTRWRRR